MASNNTHLVWLDLEMTGLDTQRDRILEIATIVTDAELNILEEGPVFAIHQPDAILAAMDDWNREHHGNSGLIARVRDSRIDVTEAERQTLAFIARYVPPQTSPMCGNTICQDRRFLARWMPQLECYFHYRNLDVSTLKELGRRWAPDVVKRLEKAGAHLALEDTREAIRELRYYRAEFFKV